MDNKLYVTRLVDGTFAIVHNDKRLVLTEKEAIILRGRLKFALEEKDKSNKNYIFPFAPTATYKGAWGNKGNRQHVKYKKFCRRLTICFNEVQSMI